MFGKQHRRTTTGGLLRGLRTWAVRLRRSKTIPAWAIVIAMGVSTLGTRTFAQVACRYEVAAVIQAPPCGIGDGVTRATAISPNGQVVVGYATCPLGAARPFKWTQDSGFE